jgi:hypothetical protein
MEKTDKPKAATNSKPIPHIPLPFEEVMKDVLKGEAASEEGACIKGEAREKPFGAVSNWPDPRR